MYQQNNKTMILVIFYFLLGGPNILLGYEREKKGKSPMVSYICAGFIIGVGLVKLSILLKLI